ncbi:hypothetical protein LSAT2_031944 [Lamellibrachia satsuma]|nr:hypothetical protein LSAT2_031944 [Lamellibrachia satsuma]
MAFKRLLTCVHRRIVVKNFGGWRNFTAWLTVLLVLVYLLDNYVLPEAGQHRYSSKHIIATVPSVDNLVGDLPVPSVKMDAPAEPAKEAEKQCGLDAACPQGKIAYWVQSGQGVSGQATICFNGIYAVSAEKANSQRGINMVIVDVFFSRLKFTDVSHDQCHVTQAGLGLVGAPGRCLGSA